jgi:exodeoxyribonuclease III
MPAAPLKLVSWNVNGIRSALGKGLLDVISACGADIYCFQETKAQPHQVDDLLWPGAYRRYWNSAEKAGYSGTAIFTRAEPMAVSLGIGLPELDREGRVLTLEFPTFFLVNVYTPNSQRGLTRLSWRTKVWDPAFRQHLGKLGAIKPVVTCGDFNVAHQPIDIARPKANERNAGFTLEERTTFGELLETGFIDTFRELEKGGGHYTWWSYMNAARLRNIGWRIDYFLVSSSLRSRVRDAFILPDVQGADHCPVGLTLEPH